MLSKQHLTERKVKLSLINTHFVHITDVNLYNSKSSRGFNLNHNSKLSTGHLFSKMLPINSIKQPVQKSALRLTETEFTF